MGLKLSDKMANHSFLDGWNAMFPQYFCSKYDFSLLNFVLSRWKEQSNDHISNLVVFFLRQLNTKKFKLLQSSSFGIQRCNSN